MTETLTFYRYWDTWGNNGEVDIREETFRSVKKTPQGHWITNGIKKRWVSNHSEKRYAYPTREEAMNSFRRRKRAQIKLLRPQLRRAKEALVKTVGKIPPVQTFTLS